MNESLRFEVVAQVGSSALRQHTEHGFQPIQPTAIGLSDRLCKAFDDWAQFFDEIAGDLSDAEVAEEFVSQGYKIAHRLRAEIKGSTVHLVDPTSGEPVEILRTGPR